MNNDQSWRRAPFAFLTLSTETGEWINRGLNCRLGLELQHVTFADHRSGWAGLKLHIYLVCWYFSFCLVKWRTPFRRVSDSIYTLAEQVRDTHGDRWADYDARMAEDEADARQYLALQDKLITDYMRRNQN